MSFNLLAFAGGAASAFTEEIDKAEKEAKTYGLAKAKVLYERYGEVEKENKKLESEARADIDMIRAKYTGASAFSDDQLVALAAKPEIRKALLEAANKDYFDPSVLNPAQIVKLKEANPATGTLTERISKMYELPKMMEEKLKAMTPEQKQKLGFFGNIEYKAERAAMERFGVAAGVPIGQMEAALKASKEAKPEMAEFNLSGLGKKPREWDKELGKARLEFADAQVSNDPVKLRDTAKWLGALEAAADKTKDTPITEPAEQKKLVDKIMAETDPKKRAALENELRRRQFLQQRPDQSNRDKDDTLNNWTKIIGGTIAASQKMAVGIGKYDQDINGNIFIKSTEDAPNFREGTLRGIKIAIEAATDKTGRVLGPTQARALIASGIDIDRETGKPIIPELKIREISGAGAAKPAAPAALPQPAAAKPAAVDIATERSKALVAIEKIKKEPVENAVKQNSEAAVRKLFKEKTGQDL